VILSLSTTVVRCIHLGQHGQGQSELTGYYGGRADIIANAPSRPELGAAEKCSSGTDMMISELTSRNYQQTLVQLPRNVSSDEHGSRRTEEGRSKA
jgi:hypothetical protein